MQELYITTKDMKRTSISDLPFGHMVTCNRVGGWELWLGEETRLAGEYEPEHWLVLDVDGQVICDSRPEQVKGQAIKR